VNFTLGSGPAQRRNAPADKTVAIMEPSDDAVLSIIGAAIARRLRRRAKKPSAAGAAPEQISKSPSLSGISIVTWLLKTVAFISLLIVYLVVEMAVSMLAYVYLNLYQINTFGYLIRLSRNLLTTMQTTFEAYVPQLADRAYATLLGEIGPKSILLLFLGLTASTLIRLIVWVVNASFSGIRSSRPAARAAVKA
jgi:hypothetical protein